MLKKKSIGIALACALALGAWSGAAIATPVNVGGVMINPDSPLNLSIHALQLRETSVANVGDVLTGYGVIGSINGTDEATFCPGCDLNFTFQYTLSHFDNSGHPKQAVFKDGTLNFYVDDSQSFNVTDPSTAGMGTLWLSLDGHTAPHTGFTAVGQLYSTISGTLADPTSGSTGVGLLDVTGGPAASFVNTNLIPDGVGGFADLSLNSSFLTQSAGICSDDGTCYPIEGTGEILSKQAVAVPEPGELGLLGLGLAVLGFFVWKRRKETEKK